MTATPITINGEKIKRLIARLDRADYVDLLALPELVEFAERQEFQSDAVENYLRRVLEPYAFEKFSSIVLGCTHFNYFKDTLRSLLPPDVRFVDGNEGTLRELARPAAPRGAIEVRYYYSGRAIEDAAELERIEKYLMRLDRMIEID